MGICQELINFDRSFATLSHTPHIVNDIMNTTEEEKERLKKEIFIQYSNVDLLSNMPACDCNKVKGEYALGVICTNCNTPVISSLEQSIEPLLWMRSPRGVNKLINPIVWTMLSARFTISSFDIVQWLCDTTYRPSVKEPKCLYEIEEAGVIRGYNNFVQNFDAILNILVNLKSLKKIKKGQTDYLLELLQLQRDCIFSDYLPLPNKSLLVIEDNSLGTYVDPIVIGAIDAIQTIASIDNSMSQMSIRTKENRTIKAIIKLAEFYDNYYKESLAKKGGVFRKHIYGSRSYFSFRAVISSITEPHEYDEIHIPWPIAVTSLRIHIMNKLFKMGYDINTAIGYLNEHTHKYSKMLDDIFTDLIESSPGKGLYCITQRNPSLERASAQRTRITKVKKDPAIPTVSISILIVKGLNADFDGDALNFSLAIDNLLANELRHLDPHKSTFDIAKPYNISNNLSQPKPVIATQSLWLGTLNDIGDSRTDKMIELANM